MRLHAIVSDLDTASLAAEGGATVLQLRLKNQSTEEVVAAGSGYRDLCRRYRLTFVVNDDVEAALALEADGVHLGRVDPGARRAVEAGLLLGSSAAGIEEALDAERFGAAYIGAGPIWSTPSKLDADPPIGLKRLAAICEAVSIPVVAIGGVDAGNAESCIDAGATGVAVLRAASDPAPLLEAIERAAR